MRTFSRWPGARGAAIPLAALALLTLPAVSCSRLKWSAASLFLGLPPAESGVAMHGDAGIPMRDGTVLRADVYRPARPGRYPAVLYRTPYGKRNPGQKHDLLGELFASHGFVAVVQDTRGRHRSGGDFRPLLDEASDGADTVDWMASQEWSNGKVGMFGIFLEPMLEDFQRIRIQGRGNARESRLVIGPWTHAAVSDVEELRFGSEAGFMKQIPPIHSWYARWLEGVDDGTQPDGPTRLFVMGRDEWRTEQEWPLARTRYRSYYRKPQLGAGGSAPDRLQG